MVKNRTLLLLAAMVWGAAGFNIARIGALAYPGNESLFHAAVSLVVFVLFWRMFHKLVGKHTARIKNFAREKQYFWRFFDKKSFLIMAFIIFCIVKAINKMLDLTKKKEEHKEEAPTTKICPFCKSEIPIDAVKCCHCTSDLPKEDE